MNNKKTIYELLETEPKSNEIDCDDLRERLASWLIKSLYQPYLSSKDCPNQQVIHQIEQGSDSQLCSLYLLNPVKFLEFSIRLTEGLVQRVSQIGTKTYEDDPHLIENLGTVRKLIQLGIAMSFAIPKSTISLLASPDTAFRAPGNMLKYYFSPSEASEGDEQANDSTLDSLLTIIDYAIYLTLWATFIAYSSLILFITALAFAPGSGLIGTVLMVATGALALNPASLFLMSGTLASAASIHAAPIGCTLVMFLLPIFASIAGFEPNRPADARYNYADDKQEAEERQHEFESKTLAEVLDSSMKKSYNNQITFFGSRKINPNPDPNGELAKEIEQQPQQPII